MGLVLANPLALFHICPGLRRNSALLPRSFMVRALWNLSLEKASKPQARSAYLPCLQGQMPNHIQLHIQLSSPAVIPAAFP